MRFKNVFSVFNRRRSLSTGKSAIVRQEDFNDLYRLANYAGKGTLVNILRNDGPSVLFDYMACVLPEYISAHPHANGYWLPTRRGEHGETLLHVLLICNTSDHTRIAIDLLRLHPLLARDVMLSKEYGGVSPLHLSIAYCNQKMIDALLDLKVDVNQRATGSFFAINHSRYKGEFAHCWAACKQNRELYDQLLVAGADPDLADREGNTVLHVLVVRKCRRFFSFALNNPIKAADPNLCNHQGHTPLQLACALGHNIMFHEIAELRAQEFWSYSRIKCCGYPLKELDSMQIVEQSGKKRVDFDQKTALNIVLNGENEEHIEMLRRGLLQKLLEVKWKTYGKKKFFYSVCSSFFYLISLTLAVFLRKPIAHQCSSQSPRLEVMRYTMELVVCLFCLRHLLVNACYARQWKWLFDLRFFHDTGFSQRIFQVSCVLILTCIPLRIVGHRIMEEQLLVFAIPASHLLLISHAASFRLTGPFVAMIRHMLLKDVTKFSMIYLLFLYAFSLPFHFLLQHQDAADGSSHLQSAISSFNKTNETAARSDQSMFDRNTLNSNNVWAYASGWMRLFKMTLGNHNQSQLRFARFGWLTIAMVVLFIILVPILLLNMLIAMMGNTYGKVIAKSEREWSRQWAKMLMQLERSLSTEEAIACIDAYSMILPKSTYDKVERAMLVIRLMNKSKAQLQREAQANWKKLKAKVMLEVSNRKPKLKRERSIDEIV